MFFTQKIKDAANSTQQSNQGKAKTDIKLKSLSNGGGSINCAYIMANQKKTCIYNVGVSSKKLFPLLNTNLTNSCAYSINSYCKNFTCIDNRLENNNRLSEHVSTSERKRFFTTRLL
ncbi:hypothetical protein CDIK_0995 [Cucumispora dikerogammari]|nr:hypothetical protein CDIK_0995 [Cucumispora dikerogammari]